MSAPQRPWQVLRRRTIYTSAWVNLHRDDVLLPDGSMIDGYHVVDYPQPAAGMLPIGDDGRLLLLEQYRFITDTISWQLPAGRVEADELPAAAALRELHEETGYQAGQLEALGHYHPMHG